MVAVSEAATTRRRLSEEGDEQEEGAALNRTEVLATLVATLDDVQLLDCVDAACSITRAQVRLLIGDATADAATNSTTGEDEDDEASLWVSPTLALPAVLTVRITGDCERAFVPQLGSAQRVAWAANFSAALGLPTTLEVPPPCYVMPPTPPTPPAPPSPPSPPAPPAAPPSAPPPEFTIADFGDAISTSEALCDNMFDGECIALWLVLAVLALCCCCCCLWLLCCLRRRRREEEEEEIDDPLFDELVDARQALIDARERVKKAHKESVLRTDAMDAADTLSILETWEGCVEVVEERRVALAELEAKLISDEGAELHMVSRAKWESFLMDKDQTEEFEIRSLRAMQELVRLPSVWEEMQEHDEEGVLTMTYINVETGEVRYEQAEGDVLRAVLDDYRGEGDWAGADEDADDDYVPDLDAQCDRFAAKLRAGKVGEWGEGDWLGADEDADDDYEPGLEDAFTLLDGLLRKGTGDWLGADEDEDDAYDPEAVDAALGLLDRYAKKQRRKNLRVQRNAPRPDEPDAEGASRDKADEAAVGYQMQLVKRGLARKMNGAGDWGGAIEDDDDEYDVDDLAFGGLRGLKLLRRGEGDWAGAETDEDDEFAPGEVDAAFSLLQKTLQRHAGKARRGAHADENDELTLLVPRSVVAKAAKADDDDSGTGDGETVMVYLPRRVVRKAAGLAKTDGDDASPGDDDDDALVGVAVPRSALRAAALALPDVGDGAGAEDEGGGDGSMVGVKVRRGALLRALGIAPGQGGDWLGADEDEDDDGYRHGGGGGGGEAVKLAIGVLERLAAKGTAVRRRRGQGSIASKQDVDDEFGAALELVKMGLDAKARRGAQSRAARRGGLRGSVAVGADSDDAYQMEAAVELVRRELDKRAAKAGRRAPRGHRGSVAVRRDRDDAADGGDGLGLDTTELANDALAYLVWASQTQYRMSDVDLSAQLERAITLLKKRRATARARASKTASHADRTVEATVGAAA